MKKILLVPGDGIGPEVMAEAKRLIEAIEQKHHISFALEEVDWGAERWLREKVGIPKDVLHEIPTQYDAILFGALGDPRIPDMAHGREILLGLRFGLDLFINLRPVKLFDRNLSVLKKCTHDIDIVIFRENTEDIYRGLGKTMNEGTADEITIDESRHTFRGVSRIINAAFVYAEAQKRKRVTLVDKSNAIKYGGSLWQRIFKDVAKQFPSIKSDHLFVDVAAMQMVQNPGRFDVIVTSNLFGDILSDLGAGLVGGLGLAASANLNPDVIGLFEPVHGSAPDIAGKGLANPFAMFLSVAMMMTYLGYEKASASIEKAIEAALKRGLTTKDLGGSLSSRQACDHILAFIESDK